MLAGEVSIDTNRSKFTIYIERIFTKVICSGKLLILTKARSCNNGNFYTLATKYLDPLKHGYTYNDLSDTYDLSVPNGRYDSFVI
jgi:hypothetical protein